jgi:2-desacetyl-2-hydroxyethyl bacteriochlorophyllide A dehydrogenase
MNARSLWFSRPKEIEFREEEVEPPRGDEILVQALYSGISHGTEMLVYRGDVPRDLELDASLTTIKGSFRFPVKYGYSSVGKVVELGSIASRLCRGDVVFVHHPHQTSYVVPENMAVKLPQDSSPMLGVFVANLETALNCILDSDVRLGESVAIFGQGVIGLLVTQLAKKCGADKVFTVDRIERRREVSRKLGADFSFGLDNDPAQAIKELTDGTGVDVVIEASGSPEALDYAIKSAAFEGLVVVVSWYGTKPATLHLGEQFHRERIKIKSSQVSHVNAALAPRWSVKRRTDMVIKLLPQLNLDELISDVVPFEEAQAAYEKIDKAPEETLQVVLSYV